MRKIARLILLVVTLELAVIGCGTDQSFTTIPQVPSQTSVPPKVPTQSPTSSPSPSLLGEKVIITSSADSGPGTLRQALQDAQTGDIIIFDPIVFPPSDPTKIAISSSLPEINQGRLTIDASNAGVIIDGSSINAPDPQLGISISSDHNTIRGLQITGFSDAGIGLYGGAQYNVIGGEQSIGDGRLGQGNLISGNGNFGIGLWDEGTSYNTIEGNYIGVNIDGISVSGHARDGVHSNGANNNLITGNLIGGNDTGIYLCCVANGGNRITKNFVGTDESGTILLGNRSAGILVDRTSYNVFGPYNIIANNTGPGIMLWEDTSFNTITQNSIRDNSGQGISIVPETVDDPRPLPPIIFDFDLQAGTVSGEACAHCSVELYSDKGNEGGFFEGQTEADEAGVFTFEKGSPLNGPYLTATATDPDGSSSKFSFHTEGANQHITLQKDNFYPITLLENKPSSELANNRIGDTAEVQHVGSRVWNAGTKWMRVIIDPYGEWQHVDWEKGEYAVDQESEEVIDDLVRNDVTIMLVLDVWHLDYRTNYYKSQEDIATYLNWVGYMVEHFNGRIAYYEIMNEPILSFELPSGMPVDAYVNLVKQTVPIIREEDPEAKIVVGAVPDTRFDDARDWMWGLLNSEVMPLVDGISWHGMYGAAPTDDPRGVRDPGAPQMTNYWENYPAFVEEIKTVAASNGFEGEFLIEEMLWRTPSYAPHESEPFGFTDVSGAKYYARSIIIHLGHNVSPGLAIVPEDIRPISYSAIRNLSTIMAGTHPSDLPVVVESEASNLKYYSFTLSNGHYLVALWTDGVAVEDNPGIKATLTIPNFSVAEVVGIDVLFGFEQQLIVDAEDGNLVVRDLLIKDYPIILRTENVSSP